MVEKLNQIEKEIDETIKDLSADPTEAKDRALLALFDALFDRDVNLIDTEYLYRQFELYIKYDPDKLLSFLRRKKAQNPSGFTLGNDKALEKCREAELFVEMAFMRWSITIVLKGDQNIAVKLHV